MYLYGISVRLLISVCGECQQPRKPTTASCSPHKRNHITTTMAAAEQTRDLPSATFMAGSYQFTRAQATQLARLYSDGVPMRRLLEEFYPDATLEQVIVAVQVGIVLQGPSSSLDFRHLHPDMLDPQCVLLGWWRLGEFRLQNE